jgi:hypothetical protein
VAAQEVRGTAGGHDGEVVTAQGQR